VVTGLDAIKYSAASARVRGLYSQLLDRDTWISLVEMQGHESVVQVLRTTSYAAALREAERAGQVAIERLERLLLAQAARNERLAMRLTHGNVRQVILVWWQHFELENLKAVFRGVDQGLSPAVIQGHLIPLGEYATLPWEALTRETTVGGLVDRLRDTHYFNPLRNALPAYEGQDTLFPIEVALDIRYYRDLAAAVRHLGGADAVDARRLIGTWLDILNILWAYRYREYYRLSAEEIVNYTLWHAERTDADLVREIALGAAPDDIVSRVFGPGSVALDLSLISRDATQWMHHLEMALHRYWRRLALREMGGYPFHLGALLGYLILQELEVRDLVTLLEAKYMDWGIDLLTEHLIRTGE